MKKILTLGSILSVLLLTGQGCISLGGPTAAGPLGTFRSADKGETWVQVNNYPTAQGVKNLAGVKVYNTFTDPSDPNALYLATRGQGLFFTYNKGDIWQSAGATLANKFIYAVAVDPKDKCTVLASDGPRIYKSTDCNRTWTLVYTDDRTGERVVSIAFDYGNSKNIYAALLSGEVLQSVDAGASWRMIKNFAASLTQYPAVNLQYLATDPLKPGRIYAAQSKTGLARSDDGGATWTDLSAGFTGFTDSLSFYRLVLHPTEKDIVFWVSKYGILRSNDAGKTWADLKLLTPPGSVNIYALAISPKNSKEMYYVGTVLGVGDQPSRSTFYKTVDGGGNWLTKKLPTNNIPVSVVVHPVETNTVFVAFTIQEQP